MGSGHGWGRGAIRVRAVKGRSCGQMRWWGPSRGGAGTGGGATRGWLAGPAPYWGKGGKLGARPGRGRGLWADRSGVGQLGGVPCLEEGP